jgi:hypothetical protein
MAEFHIRGGLGTQILSLYACYAIAIEKNETVDKLLFNHGFYSSDTKEPNIIFVDKIVRFKQKPEFVIVQGTNKTSPFTTQNVNLIIKHWDRIQQEVLPKKKLEQTNERIIHIRQKDRALVPIEKFDKLITSDVTVISDDPLVYQRYGIEAVDDTVKDWERICSATMVMGGYSTYTLLAGMLNPNMKLYFIRKEDCVSRMLSGEDWNALDMYVNAFDNINWVTL